MFFDFCMIMLSSFATFGLYCLFETFSFAAKKTEAPRSVTLILCEGDSKDIIYKAEYIRDTVYNNRVILLSEKGREVYPGFETVDFQSFSGRVENALFTKDKG